LSAAIEQTGYSLSSLKKEELLATANQIELMKSIKDDGESAFNTFTKHMKNAVNEVDDGWNTMVAGAGEATNKILGILSGLSGALSSAAGFAPQQQVSKKKSLFGKILGFAAPFISLLPIPGAGLISMAATTASQALQGNTGGALSSLAGGLASGGAINNLFRPSTLNTPAHSDAPGHAMGLSYVPRDNYIARLHRGEGVLTAAANANAGGLHPEHAALLGDIRDLLARLQAVNPGDVVAMGAHRIPDAIGRNASLNRKMQLNMGMA
jgi:hypothetical protein